MQEHDGEQLAGLGEDEGQVVNVRETGISEGRGERRGDADEEQRDDDLARGEDRRYLLSGRRREEEVEKSGYCRECGLDGV